MKKQIFRASFSIFSLILTAFLLTGCDERYYDSPAAPDTEETDSNASDPEYPASETAQPASFSHAKRQDPYNTEFVFPETAPFIDDTGRSMQRDGDCLYFYYDGRLMCFHNDTAENTLLYRTASIHNINFCLSGDYVYFVERTGYDSLDDKDTSLYRIKKDGSGLTLLQDKIVNSSMLKGTGCENYLIDIYDNTLYLINYTSEYENRKYIEKTANFYYRLENDGSVSEIPESETLYGTLPRRFSPVYSSNFPTLPYAMRNYCYIFIQDSAGTLYRMDPASGAKESLDIDITEISSAVFSGDILLTFFYSLGKAPSFFHLTNKTMYSLKDFTPENNYFLTAFQTEQGVIYCFRHREPDNVSDETVSGLTFIQVLPDGTSDTLSSGVSSSSLEENFYDTYFRYNSCVLGDHLYYFDAEETYHHLMRVPVREKSSAQKLDTWTPFPVSSPAEILSEENDDKTEIENVTAVTSSIKKLYLKEQTYSDTLINRTLKEIYTDFETNVDDITKEVQEQMEADPDFYDSFSYSSGYDFSLFTSLDYMDDDTISFCCSNYRYYAGAAHGFYWSDYYVFDRHTGERLAFEDFEGDSASILSITVPYVEKAAEWEFDQEMLLEQSRFSLSEDGYTLYFAPYAIGCYASGAYLITIPYEAFEKKL